MFLPSKTQDKFNTLTMAPDTLPRICAHVANGGSMIDLCDLWGVPYGHMLEWINADGGAGGRFELYQRAMTAQMYWAIDRVLKELKTLGTIDLSGAYADNGALLHPKEMPEDVRRAIAGIDVMEEFEGVGKDRELVGYTKKVKFFDKIKALELMGKKFAMFIDRSKVDLTEKSLEELIHESMGPEPIDVTPLPPDQPGQSVAKDETSTGTPRPGETGGVPAGEGPIPELSPNSDEKPLVTKEQLPDIAQNSHPETEVAPSQPETFHGKA